MSDRQDTGLDQYEFNTETHPIVCSRCDHPPALVALDKNDGTVVGCDCEGAKYTMDAVPYELRVQDMPDAWEVRE